MPLNDFSIGRDVSLDIMTPSGPLRLNKITGFTAKQDITDHKVKGLDGITTHLRFPDGWAGSFDIERMDSSLDDYFATIEANYYAGLNEKTCTILETVSEPTGATTQYRFERVLLKYDDAGDWKGDSSVKQKVSFVAARRVKVA